MAKLSADLGWGPAVTNGNKQIGMLGGDMLLTLVVGSGHSDFGKRPA